VAELAKGYFVEDARTVAGVVIAGVAQLKEELADSKLFDPRIKVMAVYDVAYGMEPGLKQAIEQSAQVLNNASLLQEQRVLGTLFEAIARDSPLYALTADDCLYALENGGLDTLLLWERLPLHRYVLRNTVNGQQRVVVSVEQPRQSGFDELVASERLVDWLCENVASRARIALVSDQSALGAQFCKGLGGIAGLLRYAMSFPRDDDNDDDDDDDNNNGTSDEECLSEHELSNERSHEASKHTQREAAEERDQAECCALQVEIEALRVATNTLQQQHQQQQQQQQQQQPATETGSTTASST